MIDESSWRLDEEFGGYDDLKRPEDLENLAQIWWRGREHKNNHKAKIGLIKSNSFDFAQICDMLPKLLVALLKLKFDTENIDTNNMDIYRKVCEMRIVYYFY